MNLIILVANKLLLLLKLVIIRLKLGGAQGGDANGYDGLTKGGLGGYATGIVYLNASDTLNIVFGGAGNSLTAFDEITVAGNGYNGGGGLARQDYVQKCGASGGGGATHIAKVTGKLADIGYTEFVTNGKGLIVAGGGSGYVGDINSGETIAGNASMPTHDGNSTMIGNSGNGFVKIIYIGTN